MARIKRFNRGMIVDVDLEPVAGSEMGKIRPCVIVTNDRYNARSPVIHVAPITAWNEKKGRIVTNVVLKPTSENGLTKKSVIDCLHTRPIDHRIRVKRIRGRVSDQLVDEIDKALKRVFALK